MEINFSAVQAIGTELQSYDKEAMGSQSIAHLSDLGFRLAGWVEFTGQEAIKAEKFLMDERGRIRESLRSSAFTPTMIKDIQNEKTSQHKYVMESIKQTNDSAKRTLDFLRSCISALKSEINANMYHSNQR